jgi:hypothetical protein
MICNCHIGHCHYWHKARLYQFSCFFTMNLPHALGFFVLGLAMIVLPELAPALAPANAVFGDVSALWLQVMGAAIFLIGSGYTAKGLAAALPKPPVREQASVAATARARERSSLSADGSQATV